MKLRITMEIEVGDLTDEQRAELEDDLNFVSREKFGTDEFPSDEEEEGYVPTVPTLAEQSPEDISSTLSEALYDIDEWQDEMWAGTDCYARIVNVSNVQVEAIKPDPDCEAGLHSWINKTGKLPPDTACTRCGELYGDPD